MVRQSNFMKLA